MKTMQDDLELERLYDDHASSLYAYLLNLTRSQEDTRDVLQGIFIKLARQPGLIRRARDERAFLLRLAHNAAIDLLRRRSTRTRHHEEFGEESNELFVSKNELDEPEFRRQLELAMSDLPEDQRAVVHLKLREEMTFEQIGETLNISPNTAASRYRYGIDKLRECLRPLYEELQ